MNGFNPLGGLKNWHVNLALTLAAIGLVAGAWKIVEVIIWLFKHVTIQ
jgi:hypothetical protein